MITPGAAASLDWLFDKALKANGLVSPDDEFIVTAGGDAVSAVDATNSRLIALGISSYRFRIVSLFRIATDTPTVAHFSRLQGNTGGPLEGQALLDALCEFANRVCGEVNRGLTAEFRHSGMSTPFVLDGSCMEHVAALDPTYVKALEVSVNQSARFSVTVCACVDRETTLDFLVDRSATADESAGELELF